ncbi:hypothetical protein IFO70_23625 [Phormidium tenue FACHB-886]|nr:hypothetical protein [Phormidium tenue FACHB-886]
MKQIKTQPNINSLLQDLPESTQQVIRGGSDGSVRFLKSSLSSSVGSISGGTHYTGYVKVSEHG